METGKFRKRRNKFSQISNIAIQDETMSCQSRFLYCLISSYISIPDFQLYKSFIQRKASLGKDAFNKYWKELKDRKYLIQYELRDEKGHIYYEYELLDEPAKDDEINNDQIDDFNKNGVGDSNGGLTVSGFSGTGKTAPLIINKKNNIKKNNINFNNNTKSSNSEFLVDSFFSKIVVDQKEELINTKLKTFLSKLKKNELDKINSLDPTLAKKLYAKAIEIFNDESILNKEGYLRSIIKTGDIALLMTNEDIKQSTNKYNKQTYIEQEQVYDDSNNPVFNDERRLKLKLFRNEISEDEYNTQILLLSNGAKENDAEMICFK